MKLKNAFAKLLFLFPALLVYFYFVIVTTGLSFPYSVSQLKPNSFVIEKFIGLKNFFRMFTDEYFQEAVRNTLIYVLLSVVFIMFFSILVSVLINYLNIKKMKGYGFFRSVYLIPATLSSVIVALLWYFIYHPEIGLLNGLLKLAGLGQFSQAWLANQKLVLIMLVIVSTWQWSGFYIILIFTAITSNVSKEIYEAAYIDGISETKLITKIVLPLISGTVENCVVLSTIGSIKAFDLIWLMTKGGPVNSSEVFVTYMFRRGFEWGDFGYATSIGFALLIICLVITLVLRAVFKSRNYLSN